MFWLYTAERGDNYERGTSLPLLLIPLVIGAWCLLDALKPETEFTRILTDYSHLNSVTPLALSSALERPAVFAASRAPISWQRSRAEMRKGRAHASVGAVGLFGSDDYPLIDLAQLSFDNPACLTLPGASLTVESIHQRESIEAPRSATTCKVPKWYIGGARVMLAENLNFESLTVSNTRAGGALVSGGSISIGTLSLEASLLIVALGNVQIEKVTGETSSSLTIISRMGNIHVSGLSGGPCAFVAPQTIEPSTCAISYAGLQRNLEKESPVRRMLVGPERGLLVSIIPW